MPHSVSGGDTFYGYIPEGSNELHLGIVLGVKEHLLKYCYGTSKYKRLFNEVDFIKIPKTQMEPYFSDAKDTYIFLSPWHIIDLLVITYTSRIDSGEYDQMGLIDKDIFIGILSKIRNSDNLSDRFKQDFFNFLE